MFGNLFKSKHSVGKVGEKLPAKHEGLPDSTLPQGLCPRCQKQSSFDVIGSQAVTFDPDSQIAERDGSRTPVVLDQVSVLLCRNCRQAVVVVEERCTADSSWREQKNQGGVITWRGVHWWPGADVHVSVDVPADIADVFQEAVRAFHAQCYRSAAVMARGTLEAVTVDKGETSGTLSNRLKALATRGVLQPTLTDWAKEVRLVGNAGAHVDQMKKVSNDDASQLISFVRELLRYLYEVAAELARRRGP